MCWPDESSGLAGVSASLSVPLIIREREADTPLDTSGNKKRNEMKGGAIWRLKHSFLHFIPLFINTPCVILISSDGKKQEYL